ncbi:PTR2 domain-containing protein [Cephalotus follicularis]|uniref:PTR2 domain-containing protein n=1 Tax=Cephalotus follicularis TaxID=3775 RepID=A0A1Q3BTY8_CEPFO|nr:PTR2 domain-containing protein [Cephalotus follicularis]
MEANLSSDEEAQVSNSGRKRAWITFLFIIGAVAGFTIGGIPELVALKTEGDIRPNGSIASPWRLCKVQQVEDFKTLIRSRRALSAQVKTKRLHIAHNHHLQLNGYTLPMLALWLFPQLILVGIGETFYFPGQVALYNQEFPTSLQSTATAMVPVIIGAAY